MFGAHHGLKKNNTRGQIAKDRLKRKEDAAVRQAGYDSCTPQQLIAHLDNLFGPGLGAKKERAKLNARIEVLRANHAKLKAADMKRAAEGPAVSKEEIAEAIEAVKKPRYKKGTSPKKS